jgi:glycosyltransferase involved in cell wall biosynthesis
VTEGTKTACTVAAIVLTYNEEIHIGRCLETIRKFCNEIFVIDAFSSDRTVEIARAYGATVMQNPFINQAIQFQWALDHVPTLATWILRLDADEIVDDELAAEILEKLPLVGEDVVGVHLKRKHIFLNRWIKHGGRYPLYLLRLWRRGYGSVEQSWMDEHMVVRGGRTVEFRSTFSDHNLKNLSFFVNKHNQYATREAVKIFARRRGLSEDDSKVQIAGQAGRKRIFKRLFYDNLPFAMGPTLYFLYRYIVQLGFMDGVEGLIYHLLQGFWYRFLVDAKLLELEREISKDVDPQKVRFEIQRLTGLEMS